MSNIQNIRKYIYNRVKEVSLKDKLTYTRGEVMKLLFDTGLQVDNLINAEVREKRKAERTDEQILFFTAGSYNKYCIPAYKYGDHYFGY